MLNRAISYPESFDERQRIQRQMEDILSDPVRQENIRAVQTFLSGALKIARQERTTEQEVERAEALAHL